MTDIRRKMRMSIKLKALAAALAAVTALSCASVTAFADKLKTVDGIKYRYSDKPKKNTVKCWPDKYKNDYSAYDKYENVTVSDMGFTPKKGGYIYEVYASWNEFTVDGVAMSGDCYYTVYIIAG